MRGNFLVISGILLIIVGAGLESGAVVDEQDAGYD